MTTIALNFKGTQTDKNGKTYFIFSPVKDILPITIDENKLLCVKQAEQKSEKSPKWVLDMFVPDPEKSKKNETENLI